MAQKKTIHDLNGLDVEESLPTRSSHQLGARRSGGITSSIGAGATGATTIPDVHYAGSVSLTGTSTGIDYSLNADGTMSEEVMHNYLDRVLQVTYLSSSMNADGVFGPSYINTYPYTPDLSYETYVDNIISYRPWNHLFPLPFDPTNILYDQGYDHGKLLDKIVNTGAKFIWSLSGFWTGHDISPDNLGHRNTYFDWVLYTLNFDTAYIHHYDPEVICSADISESITQITGIPIPDYVKEEFRDEITILGGLGGYFEGLAIVGTTFETTKMQLWPGQPGYADAFALYGNISLIQTRMWFYYLAINFIGAGCEAIHFGDIFNIIGYDKDNGLKYVWSVMERVRNYAKLYARRHFVILDAHTRVYSDGDPFQFGYYYDPNYPDIYPISQRQLIFDFHTGSISMEHYTDAVCVDAAPVFGQSDQREFLAYGAGLLNNSFGGINPQGWLCSHNPAFVDFDNADNDTAILGCHARFPLIGTPYFYGFESTSWFANQAIVIKDLILKYNYYKIKCLDPYNHWAMPGRLIYHIPNPPGANPMSGFIKGTVDFDAVLFTNFDTIKALWNNVFVCANDWSIHNFSQENVLSNNLIAAYKSLCLVGSDLMFYITEAGDIFGYVYVEGIYNRGTWLGVSPTYSSQIFFPGNPDGIPVPAKSDLIANPEGTVLLYLGVDNYIHSFDIVDKWRYRYRNTFKGAMLIESIIAAGSLIWPKSDRIYYIGTYNAIGAEPKDANRLHGFQQETNYPNWVTVSPTYSAASRGYSIYDQLQAWKSLTYVETPGLDKIYYLGFEGRICYYDVIGIVDYNWVDLVEGNNLLDALHKMVTSKLAIHVNTIETNIYFIAYGTDTHDDTYYVYCLNYNGITWELFKLNDISYTNTGVIDANSSQADSNGEIAISPDGSTIIYFSINEPIYYNAISYYKKRGTTLYQYSVLTNQNLINNPLWFVHNGNSLQFKNDYEFFFIIPTFYNSNVFHIKWQESYCSSSFINEYSG